MYTIKFGVTPPTAPDVANPEADITWSVAGNFVTRRVSVVNGASISGTGEAVKVAVRDRTLAGLAGVKSYPVTIMVTPGTRPAIEQPPILAASFFGFGLIAGATLPVTIPRDAGPISMNFQAAAVPFAPLADEDLVIQQFAGATLLTQCNWRDFTWITIHPNADRVDIVNTTAATKIFVGMVFGIDG